MQEFHLLGGLHFSCLEIQGFSIFLYHKTNKVKKNKLIFLTNDDGVHAKGLNCLIEVAREFGDVAVVAPKEAMSGMSHAITIKSPLRVKKIKEEKGLIVYSCAGTPVDCVKLAFNQLLDQKPDLVLSGINHGSNSSASVVYSGTMGAAMEACVNLVPSIGFSLSSYSADADFSEAKKIARKVIDRVLKEGLDDGVCLNVNVPEMNGEAIKGIKIGRQAKGFWKEEFDRRVDPHNGEYFWLTGYYHNEEPDSDDTDEFALANNYASVCPVTVDLTAYHYIEKLKKWDL